VNNDKCQKRYLFIDSNAFPNFQDGVDANNTTAVAANASKIQSTVPIDAESLVVTWDFRRNSGAPDPDFTRYIITVDRVNGSCFSPVARFQVPISRTPLNDCCAVSQNSQLKGCSQPFRVRLCAGDELSVGLTRNIGENCIPGQCGAGPTPGPVQIDVETLQSVIVNLYLF
jgi:hypothetical protein